jgi:hypothetical protein
LFYNIGPWRQKLAADLSQFEKQWFLEFRFQFWLGWFSIINNLIII